MTPLVKHFAHLIGENSVDFNWFDVGILEPRKTRGIGPDDLRIPFDNCAFVFELSGIKRMVVLRINDRGMLFIYRDEKNVQSPAEFLIYEKDNRLFINNEIKEPADDIVSFISGIVSTIQDSLYSCKETFALIRDEAKNRRRVAKGKKPLQYEWKTVVVEPKAAASTPIGGTHASPRRHERRGHWRNLKSGKRVWVRNCWAGNAALGTVFKDYVVKGDNR